MGLTGYLKIPDIDGESLRAEHEDEVDVFGVRWKIAQKSSANVGRGRVQARAEVDSLTCYKYYDASSPYIALSAMQGKSFDEVVLCVRKDSGDVHLDYLKVTMTNCIVSEYSMINDGVDPEDQLIKEQVSFSCEKINVVYTVQADDHSAGDEHEIEYDLVAGV